VASPPAFFHAPEEVLRILGTSIEKAGNARIKLAKILAKYGASDYVAPAYDSKEKAQELIGLPFAKLVDDKKKFRNGLLIEWKKEAEKKGLYNPESTKGIEDKTAY
jgi:nitrite reductase (cytochrome c-552)